MYIIHTGFFLYYILDPMAVVDQVSGMCNVQVIIIVPTCHYRPICVAEHLAPYLPTHPIIPTGGDEAIHAVAAAPFGSASILLISWAYIKMLGGQGLTDSSKIALLSANYMAYRLSGHYNLRYKNSKGRVAHELLIDLAEFDKAAGLKVADFAKRLQVCSPVCVQPSDRAKYDLTLGLWISSTYVLLAHLNMHANRANRVRDVRGGGQVRKSLPSCRQLVPTVCYVRFCDAMIQIRREAEDIITGKQPKDNNLLKNAPHPVSVITLPDHEWNR